MADNENHYPVADTAALVMLWAGSYYKKNPLTSTYLEQLDLSRGHRMLELYNSICPWYAEVIINRKHFIKNAVEELLGDDAGRTAIVNLGAGFSPLALEMLPRLGNHVRFIEVDQSNMSHKQQLYTGLIPEKSRFITCIESDITNAASLTEMLTKETGDPEHTRLIVVMEGLSYYIMRPAMERVFSSLSDLAPDLSIVFEHLKPCGLVSEERRYIPYKIFSHVRDYTGLEKMTTYSADSIRSMLGPAFSCRYYDMDMMELQRTGSFMHFSTPDSSWLSCAVAMRRDRPG